MDGGIQNEACEKTCPGKLVTVNGHKMHVFFKGQGPETFVFLSGAGTRWPTEDFKAGVFLNVLRNRTDEFILANAVRGAGRAPIVVIMRAAV